MSITCSIDGETQNVYVTTTGDFNIEDLINGVIGEILKDTCLTFVGQVVDTVSEVIFLKDDQIDISISLGGYIQSPFITGMTKTSHNIKILLDMDRMVNGEDILESHIAA